MDYNFYIYFDAINALVSVIFYFSITQKNAKASVYTYYYIMYLSYYIQSCL
jgi:hypothetical protein